MTVALDAEERLRSLVDLAVASDDSRALVEAAGQVLEHPLALVSAAGEPLAFTPTDAGGRRALAVAEAAARSGAAPPGWRVVALAHNSSRLGYLAMATGDNGHGAGVLGLLPTLLADQLRRAGLVRLQRAAFVRRLVGEPPLPPYRARREAAELGIELARAYWAAALAWRPGSAAPEAIERLEHEARRLSGRALTALLSGRLVLLHPGPESEAAGWFERVAARARELAPGSRARAIAADDPVAIDALGAVVARLARLLRLGPRSADEQPVTRAREYALDSLLAERVDAAAGTEFVARHLGRLLAWDREHGTDLMRVLEAALDFPRHDRAAERCFMHRNTFRNRLRQATELVGGSLDSPDERLAVHVALRLHRLGRVP